MHLFHVSVQNVFSSETSPTGLALPSFHLVRFSRMFEQGSRTRKPFFANLTNKTVFSRSRFLNVDLKTDIGCKFSRTLMTFKVFLQMSFPYMLQHRSLTRVAFVAMLANVLSFFEVNSLNVFHQMVLPGKRFIAVVALLQLLTVAVADMLLQGSLARVLLGTNGANKISFSCVNPSHVLV